MAWVVAYFEKLIRGINKYAGDVIKFAGDALQVVWRNPRIGPQDKQVSTTRAFACAA